MQGGKRSGLTHVEAGCHDCYGMYEPQWQARNAMGLAAQHAARNPDHAVWAEQTISVAWGPVLGGPVSAQSSDA